MGTLLYLITMLNMMNKLYDRDGKEIKIGMKLLRIEGKHGKLQKGDTCIVADIGERYGSQSISIVGDGIHRYDPKYFKVIEAKTYLPSWL